MFAAYSSNSASRSRVRGPLVVGRFAPGHWPVFIRYEGLRSGPLSVLVVALIVVTWGFVFSRVSLRRTLVSGVNVLVLLGKLLQSVSLIGGSRELFLLRFQSDSRYNHVCADSDEFLILAYRWLSVPVRPARRSVACALG